MKFVMDNLWLVLLAVVSGVGILVPTLAKRLSGIPQIGVAGAVTLINRRDALVLDVRSASEFAGSHIGNARNIPAPDLDKRIGELAKWKDKPIVVLCASGNRSHAAAKTLKAGGFLEVSELQGGLSAWTQAGMPTEK